MVRAVRSGDYGVVFLNSGTWQVMARRDLGWLVVMAGSGVAVTLMTANGKGRRLDPFGDRAVDVVRAVRRADPTARTFLSDPRYRLPEERRAAPAATVNGPRVPSRPPRREARTPAPPEKVVVDDVAFHRLKDGVWADTPYAIRVQVGKALTPEEANTLAALLGYSYAKTGGERGNSYTQDSPCSIVFWCDTTKGRAYRRLDAFFEDARHMIVHGSPPRKTKGGTRLVQGLGDVGDITFYADNVGTDS